MKRTFTLFLVFNLLAIPVFASDYHQNDQNHAVTYTITDNTGQPVSGQSVGLSIYRVSDSKFFDWTDGTFKASGWTKRTVLMPYNSTGEFYSRIISIDNGGIVSGEYLAIVSNDDTTYGDTQTEAFEIDNLSRLIKINR